MDDEKLRKLYGDAQKVKISMPETQPTMGNMKPFETQLAGTLLQTPKAPAPEESSPYEGAKAYIQKLIDSAGSRQAETVRDEKLARAQEAVLGIGDMGRALANMFAATQYAPNGFQDSGLSDKARERAERAKAERDKHRDELLNYHMAIGKMNENERSWKFQREMAKERIRQAEEAERRRQGELELKNKVFEWKQQVQDGKFNQAEADRELKKMIADKKISLEYAKSVKHELEEYTKEIHYIIDPQTGKKIGQTETRTVKGKGGGQQTNQQTQSGSQSAPYRTNNSTSKAPYVKQN